MILWDESQEKMRPKAAPEHPDVARHKQDRAVLTRRQLLRSARAIFARDGFEHARIEEIASKAGKTRGAFYDNFNDKEDVFFAIFEENLDRDLAELGPLMTGRTSFEQRVEIIGEYLRELTKDRERILLGVEFKLYSVRHPRKRKRLAALHSAMRRRGSIPELNLLLPQTKGKNSDSRLCDSPVICGLLEGLALSHFFSPEAFDHDELARYLKLCLRETLGGSAEKERKKK
jgi:AcrR family transcriptional regulator